MQRLSCVHHNSLKALVYRVFHALSLCTRRPSSVCPPFAFCTLSQGDNTRPFYALDDVVLVLSMGEEVEDKGVVCVPCRSDAGGGLQDVD